MEELERLPKILKELREQYSYTQKFVADRLEITYQTYQCYEWGKALPSLPNFIKLSKIYDVSLDYLIGNSNI